MKNTDSPTKITLKTLQNHLLSYDSHIPDKIQRLETLRANDIPQTLALRKNNSNAFLEKTEVTSLVDWKLKHGTYRPTLAKLVASNSSDDIRDTTHSAFTTYEANNDDYAKSISTLAKLKGIGPATASLLLSCYDPVTVPFFSDELYRYLHFEDGVSKGWDRKINYTMKEYKSLFEKLQALRKRLNEGSKQEVPAIDLERVAYVLGKEALLDGPDMDVVKRVVVEDEEGSDHSVPAPPPKRQKKSLPGQKGAQARRTLTRNRKPRAESPSIS